jgi:GNAT superfamily N-acetyltransferase
LSKNPRGQRKLLRLAGVQAKAKAQLKQEKQRLARLARPLPLPSGSTVPLQEVLAAGTSSKEYYEVLDLYRANFGGPEEFKPEHFQRLIQMGVYRLFILTKDDLRDGKNVAGFIFIGRYGHTYASLEYIAVSEQCQGKGIGPLIMKHLLAQLEREKKAKLLSLECKKPLVPFYQKNGAQLTCAKTSLVKELNAKTREIEEEPLCWMVFPIANTPTQFHDATFHERLRRTLYSTVHGLRMHFENAANVPCKIEELTTWKEETKQVVMEEHTEDHNTEDHNTEEHNAEEHNATEVRKRIATGPNGEAPKVIEVAAQ